MVRFQRQPPGTALTRTSSFLGMGCAVVAAVLIVDEQPVRAGVLSALSGGLLLIGGHRANHGLGGPVDRMLTELFDRAWDACVLAPIVWVSFGDRPEIAFGALVALNAQAWIATSAHAALASDCAVRNARSRLERASNAGRKNSASDAHP